MLYSKMIITFAEIIDSFYRLLLDIITIPIYVMGFWNILKPVLRMFW